MDEVLEGKKESVVWLRASAQRIVTKQYARPSTCSCREKRIEVWEKVGVH